MRDRAHHDQHARKTDTIWTMSMLQIESVAPPLDSPAAASLALRVLAAADAMGLLRGAEPIRRLDRQALEPAVRVASSQAGIGRVLLAQLRRADRPERVEEVLSRLYDALEHSPAPASEWPALIGTLGPELLADLVGVSASSLRRYAAGDRRTPDDVAERLHLIALVVGDLAGSLNDFGLRRWFQRPRVQLAGRSPAQLLRGAWRAEGAPARRVRALAYASTAPLAT